MTKHTDYDAIVVGAGFSGLYMLHRLRALGLRTVLLEAALDVGGTWYWNRYPGLRCDIESMQYCYTFEPRLDQKWRWTERFPKQAEIQRYLAFVADELDLRRDICFNTRVSAARWDDDARQWTIDQADGDRLRARYCVMATGLLAVPILPDIAGVDSFAGQSIHSARWPEGLEDFTGKRVGVIGTGSSGIQIVPEVARTARSLHVFVRSAPYAQESHNRPLTEADILAVQADYPTMRARARRNSSGVVFRRFTDSISFWSLSPEERRAEMFRCWNEGGNSILNIFSDVMTDRAANDEVAAFMRERIQEIVKDPEKARKLTPASIFGAKRLPIGTGYHHAFNRDNVDVVALRETPIETIHAGGIRTTDADYELDVLIFATGYDAGTGALANIDIVGRDDADLKARWKEEGPRAFMGIIAADFPNMFIITGPGSPGVLSNVVVSIEQHVEWTADCIAWMEREYIDVINASIEAQDAWTSTVQEAASATLFVAEDNWYTGTNIAGKKGGMMFYAGGVGPYRALMDDIASDGYRAFRIESARSVAVDTI